MENIYKKNLEIIDKSIKRSFDLLKGLNKLKYFDKTNFEKNKESLSIVHISDENDLIMFEDNQVVLYVCETNTLYINDSLLYNQLLDEDLICMYILHELMHMASASIEKNVVGFMFETMPITYNEGCTQYLTLKLLFDNNFENAIKNNTMYPQSVITVKRAVDLLGEETVFNGFFEASLKKAVDGFSPKVLDEWIDYVMELSNSLEEQIAISNIDSLESKVNGLENESEIEGNLQTL